MAGVQKEFEYECLDFDGLQSGILERPRIAWHKPHVTRTRRIIGENVAHLSFQFGEIVGNRDFKIN
jgi:hypothetical protein